MEPAILAPALLDRAATPVAALERWGGDLDSLQHVSDGAAFVYRFERDGQGYYLRLTAPSWRSRTELEGELAFVEHVRSHGVSAAAPVPSRTGAFIEDIPNRDGVAYATVAEEVRGRPVEHGDRLAWANDETVVRWGALIGRLHAASTTFDLQAGAQRRSWRDDLVLVEQWLAPAETQARTALEQAATLLDRLDQPAGRYGLIHGDLEAGNLIRGASGELWLIDFDDCTEHWYVGELATAAWFLTEEGEGERRALTQRLIDGYRSEHLLDDEWLERLPLFVRLRAISVLAWYQHSRWLGVSELDRPGREEQIRALLADPGRWV